MDWKNMTLTYSQESKDKIFFWVANLNPNINNLPVKQEWLKNKQVHPIRFLNK